MITLQPCPDRIHVLRDGEHIGTLTPADYPHGAFDYTPKGKRSPRARIMPTARALIDFCLYRAQQGENHA